MAAVTFITPTYAGDLERFCLQRESIVRCGITIPQVAIVDHEDLPLFKEIPFQNNLTLLSTQDVLPPKIEARRFAWGCRRRELRYWLHRPAIHGWMIQQLLKLVAAAVIQTEGIICLDSDTLFVDNVRAEDFYSSDGRLHLYETNDDLDAEMAEWPAHSMRFLGIKPTHQPLMRYTHAPVPFHRQVLLDMQDFVQKRYSKPWTNAFLDAEMVFEYTTYGVYARHIHGLENLAPVRPPLTVYCWWPEQVKRIEHDFLARIRENNGKAVLINSNIGFPVSSYRHLIEQAWSLRSVLKA
jgi:hypothetical protein